jgi:hypothetical protein
VKNRFLEKVAGNVGYNPKVTKQERQIFRMLKIAKEVYNWVTILQ